MKNQLLEDIGANDSAPNGNPRARGAGRGPATPPPGPVPRPKVWRGRQDAPVDETRPERPPEPPPFTAPPPFNESPSFGASPPFGTPPPFSADFSSFASQQPDLAIQLPEEPVPWTERWGRKLLGWSIATAALAAIVGAGWWIYGDTQVESTLALVADQSPAPAAPAPAAPAPAAALSAAPSPSAPVQPAPTVAAPTGNLATAPQASPTGLDAGEEAIAGEAGAADAAVIAAAARPTVGDPAPPAPRAAPVKKTARPAVRPAQPPARRELAAARTPPRVAAGRHAPPRVAAERQAPPPAAPVVEDSLEETLRQCRAAGYHASMCLKRGCSATKFGLACRG